MESPSRLSYRGFWGIARRGRSCSAKCKWSGAGDHGEWTYDDICRNFIGYDGPSGCFPVLCFYKWILDSLWKLWALNYRNDSQWRFQGFSCNSFLLKICCLKNMYDSMTTCINNHKKNFMQDHVQSSIGFTSLAFKAPRVAMVHLLAALRWGRKGFEAPEHFVQIFYTFVILYITVPDFEELRAPGCHYDNIYGCIVTACYSCYHFRGGEALLSNPLNLLSCLKTQPLHSHAHLKETQATLFSSASNGKDCNVLLRR